MGIFFAIVILVVLVASFAATKKERNLQHDDAIEPNPLTSEATAAATPGIETEAIHAELATVHGLDQARKEPVLAINEETQSLVA